MCQGLNFLKTMEQITFLMYEYWQIIGMIFLGIIILIVREGFRFRSDIEPDNEAVRLWWHIYGWMQRGVYIALLGMLLKQLHTNQIIFVILALILCSFVYNISCNIGLKQHPIKYVSKRGIDLLLKKIFPNFYDK